MSAIESEPVGSSTIGVELTPELMRQRRGQLRLIFDRFMRNKVAVAGLILLVIMALGAILAVPITGTTATYQPAIDVHPANALADPSLQHLLGTDDVGRDEFARLLFGAQVSLLIGLFSMLVAIVIGVAMGAVAGFLGGWVDALMMRITDVFLAVPLYLILFVLSATFLSRGDVLSIVLLIAVFSWAATARIVRGEFLSLKQHEFLLAARTLGAGNLRLMLRHILPNAAGPIIVSATLLVGNNIIVESTLSFFGFGLQPPTSSWGTMLAASQPYVSIHPILVFAPGLAILVTVLAVNLMGDGLRDALDPYMTER
ncbi:MAG TPA: ABC transporter permease [Ktedonobacterales bacterium]|nr:ABC transporter permease [Ktedonobacterales bacterium]